MFRTNRTYVYNYYRYRQYYQNYSNSYYINLANNNVARNTTANTTSNARPYEVTTTPVAATLTGVSINGESSLSTTGAHPYTLSDGSYTTASTNYRFNNADHYYPAQTTTTETPVGTWSVSGTGASYVSVDENDGTITVNSLPTDGDKTITLSCDPMYGTAHGTTVTKTITLKARCQTPTFSFSNTNNQVTITTGTGGATIYYTTDGSEPTTSSTLYSGPFAQSTAATIKAIAVKSGTSDSEVGTFEVVKLATPYARNNAAGNAVTFESSDDGVTFYYTYGNYDANGEFAAPTTSSTAWNTGDAAVSITAENVVKVIAAKTATATTGYITSDVYARRVNTTDMSERQLVIMYNAGTQANPEVHFLANNNGNVQNTTTFDPSTCIWEALPFANPTAIPGAAALLGSDMKYEPFVRFRNNGRYLQLHAGPEDFNQMAWQEWVRLTYTPADSFYYYPHYWNAANGSIINAAHIDMTEQVVTGAASFQLGYNNGKWQRYAASGLALYNNSEFSVYYPVEQLGGGGFLLNVAYPANYETVKEEVNKGQSVTIASNITGPDGTGTGSYGLPYYRVGNEVKYFFYYSNTSTPLASEPNEFSTDIRITYELLNGNDYIEIDDATHTYTLVRDPGRDLFVTVRITATPYIDGVAQPDGIQTKDYQFHILTKPPFPAPVISRVEGTNDYQMECSASNAVIEYRIDGAADCATYGDNESTTHPGWCLYDGSITVTTAGTIITARSYRASDQSISDPVDYRVGGAMLLPPTIEIDDDGNVTITANPANSSLDGYTSESFYYTVNGSDPDPSNVGPVTKYYSGSSFTVTNGQIVKAIAKADGFANSAIASDTYKVASGTSSYGVVTLNDYEDHTWSYYQASGDLPDGYPDELHSPYPRNVEITYYGYGNNTLSTNNSATPAASTFTGNTTAADVKVGIGEEGHTFLYYKTLERDANGRYPYELIPNPFYVRPAVTNYTGTRTLRLVMNDAGGDGWASQLQVNFSDGSATQNFQLASGSTQTETFTVNSGVTVTLSWVVGGGKNNECSFTLSYDGGAEIYSSGMGPRNGNLKVFKVAGTYTVSSYTGFYRWRVKKVTDGSIYSASSGGTALATTSTTSTDNVMLDAEQTYYFVPSDAGTTNANNATSMKVELEAMWALAAVNSNTNYGSVERNFRVARSGTQNAIISDSRPCTYSSFYPNGTTDGTTAATESDILSIHNNSSFSLSYDAKIEYYSLNANGATITANNHNLILGRGCKGSIGTVQGINSNATALNYTIRLESGTINTLSFVRSSSCTVSGRYMVRGILGCDYDRATNTNNKLFISASSTFFFSTGVTFSSNTNKDVKTFEGYVKSGSIQSGYWDGTGNAAYQQVFYCGQNSAGNTYPGVRYLTIEGGEMGSVCGGRGVGGESTTYMTPEVITFDLKIKGGLIHGGVYGGAADNPSIGSRRFIITGGEIQGWVAGGCNGTGSTSGTGATNGDSYIYVGGNVLVGGSDPTTVNSTAGGQIFGAGRGISGRLSAVNYSHVVIADHATVSNTSSGSGYVYGGSYNGNIATESNVYIVGGTVEGKVFGGSYGNGNSGAIPTANIIMSDGLVTGGVYGGSNSTGMVGNVTMHIDGGQVGVGTDVASDMGYVHGGGLGNATRVLGSVNMTIGENAGAENYVTIYGDVYGGSAQGRTNGDNSRTSGAVTNVTLNAGKIFGSLYGGGLGTNAYAANVYGPVQVTVNGGGIHTTNQDGSGAVYGCNNVNGAPQSTVAVDIYGTDAPADGREYALDAVYGGGNKAEYISTPTVKIHNCNNSIEYVYGGGNAADVAGTDVTIYGGDSIGYVFGGGNGSVSAANVSGNVDLKIYGGTIRHVFGGNNTSGTIGGTINVNVNKQTETGHDPCPMKIGEVFSGGNMAASQAGNLTIGCTGDYVEATGSNRYGYELEGIGDVYGGANRANVTGNITLTINGGIINRAFGGNNYSGDINGQINVIVNKTTSCGWYLGYVYGGGNQAAYTAPSTGFPNVSVQNGKVTYDVYGGGYGDPIDDSQGKITGSTYVEIINNGIVGHNVFGGGNAAAVSTDTFVLVRDKAKVFGNVYGGGNQGEIGGNTKVVVNGD